MTLAPSASASPVRSRAGLPWGALRRRLFGISRDEARFERRGFAPGAPETQRRLEDIGRTFVTGYLAGLETEEPESLAATLADVPLENRGFAFEGAAMALALLDLVTPWRGQRFARYLAGPGEPHAYMVHIGAGWAMARLSRRVEPAPLPLDSRLRWLALDGYGFHEGYFAWRRTVEARRRPTEFRGYEGRAFDQGLGRSLWFIECGDPARITRRIATFPAERHADLWSGIGLAAAYAGGVPAQTLVSLRDAAGEHLAHVGQGAAFAVKARDRARNPADHTGLACEILTGCSTSVAVRIVDQVFADLQEDGDSPAYETWRRTVRERLSTSTARNA